MSIRIGLLGSHENVITRRDGLLIMTDEAELQDDAMQKQSAWFQDPQNLDKKLAFAAALRRWGRETGKQDAVEHADKLLAGEL